MTAGQPKHYSVVESLVNVIVGGGIALGTQVLVFPLFGINVSLVSNIWLVVVFTAISIVRSYLLRRAFNWWHLHNTPPATT